MVVNAPGAMRDSMLMDMGGLYDKMQELATNHRIRMVVDLAFQCVNRPYFIRSSQVHEPTNNEEDFGEYALHLQTNSVRQYAEWGVRGFQASFPRYKDRMRFKEHGEWALY